MSREEAIYELERMKTWSKDLSDNEIEAIAIALKALSSSEKPCTDAISRQAVDDAIYEYSRSCDVNYSQLMEFIDKLPPVTPVEKVGQWEWEQESFTKNWGNWHCSKCREIITVCETDWAKINKPNYKYCPNCGTKMQEVEE